MARTRWLQTADILISLVILNWISVDFASSETACPKPEIIAPCRCSQRADEVQLWCSHSELPHVMAGLRAASTSMTRPIDELILENNNLPSLPGRALFTLRIMRLMLRNNGLQRVSSGWLVGLEESLMELYIVEDELRSLPMDSLDKLRKLEAVTIQSKSIKRIPSFTGLSKLRYLHIESSSLMELNPRYFRMLPALENLHVMGSSRLNRLEAGFLEDLPNISNVNISNNGINWIHLRAFSRVPSLQQLSLSGNKISDASMVGRAVRDLPSLTSIHLENNHIAKLSEASFVDLPAVKEICLARNRIVEVSQGAFHRVPMLRSLNLNYNYIRKFHPESFLLPSGSGVEELYLIGNEIDNANELRALFNAFPRLRFLDLSHNRLQEIPFGVLRGHLTLERLHLNDNRLQLIEREALTSMPALRELRLQNNSLSNILPSPFWNLPALKGLDLSFNFFRRIEPRLLANLPSLRKLNMQDNDLNAIDPMSFLETRQLESINISNNALVSFHPSTFRHLDGLFELDVSFNKLTDFVPGLPRGLESLHLFQNQIVAIPLPSSLDLDLPALRSLDISGNEIQYLPSGAMRALNQLRRLQMSRNKIKQIEDDSFDGATKLEYLDLSYNEIEYLAENSLRYMSYLKSLDVSNNKIEILRGGLLLDARRLTNLDLSNNKLVEIPSAVLQNLRELVNLDISVNMLTKLPETVIGLRALEILDVSENRLTTLPNDLRPLASLSDLNLAGNRITILKQGSVQYLPQLKELNLSDNEIDILEPGSIRSLPLLSQILLARNKIRELRDAVFSDLPSLQSAELQQNRLRTISNRAFYRVPRMLMLNLSQNLIDDLDHAGLRTLRSLEVLDLSYNKISRIQSTSLHDLEWLVELNMDNNIICNVHGAPFSGMPRLRLLSLRNNKMTSLSESSVQALRSNIALLDIDGNPLTCSCGLLWMQAWMQEAHWAGPHCFDGTMLRDARISRQHCLNNPARETEPIIPGCESELLDDRLPNHGASPWLEKIKQSSNPNDIDRPSPEESEYFYDEYVDYPFNETSTSKSNSTLHKNTTYAITTSRPNTGNTPSFYASTNMKKNVSSTVKPTQPPNVPSATFTFFGVPLPSLNINKLWGSGRTSMDRKSDQPSHIGSSRGTGRIQNYPVDAPQVQTGGFIPIISGTTGGFHPVNDAFGEPFQNTTTSWPEDFPSNKFNVKRTQIENETENTTEFNALQQIPTLFTAFEKSTHPMTASSLDNITAEIPMPENNDFKQLTSFYTTIDDTEDIEITTVPYSQNNFQITEQTSILEQIQAEENNYFNRTSPNPNISTEETNFHSNQNYEDIIQTFEKNNFDNNEYFNNTNIFKEYYSEISNLQEATTYVPLLNVSDFLPTTKNVPNTNRTNNILEYNKSTEVLNNKKINTEFWTQTTKNPGLLSDILAPNGNMPFYKPSGRPTITKVVFADQSLTNEEFVDSPSSVEIETIASYELTTVKTIYNDSSMNWYFDNYNKTNHINMVTQMEPGLNHYRSNAHYYNPNFYVTKVVLIINILYYKMMS